MSVTITAVPQELLSKGWMEGGKYIEQAIEESMPDDRISGFDVFARCVRGEQMLWLAIDNETDEVIAALVTGFTPYPNRLALTLYWVGGKKGRLRSWFKPILDVMEDYAVKSGCSHIEGFGREGWRKIMAREGWSEAYVSYEKPVGDHLQ